ncbi:hypothetical protein F4775DRAFT_309444 [Biscogniauxia sp. FL1348]|nr:hypothetical protein F4775DRAFT_309444 [Biscogniauxia sp. FL1348]
MHEKIREKAARQSHGPGANPTLLGDPVSIEVEEQTSDDDFVPSDAASSMVATGGASAAKRSVSVPGAQPDPNLNPSEHGGHPGSSSLAMERNVRNAGGAESRGLVGGSGRRGSKL